MCPTTVEDLVRALDIERCRSLENHAQGMEFIRRRLEWAALTSPERRGALMALVLQHGGVSNMNGWAREFYETALAESFRDA
jgi:hypothetical protein